MEILLKDTQKRKIDEDSLLQAGLAAMQAEGCPVNSQVSLLLCGDRRIRTLNRRWRKKDSPTDVLSFSQLESSGSRYPAIPSPPQADLPVVLGDVVISVETATKQALKSGITLDEELKFLLVHGILHLLGWDDSSPSKRNRMLQRQKEILS